MKLHSPTAVAGYPTAVINAQPRPMGSMVPAMAMTNATGPTLKVGWIPLFTHVILQWSKHGSIETASIAYS
jgi:hypothetical protein